MWLEAFQGGNNHSPLKGLSSIFTGLNPTGLDLAGRGEEREQLLFMPCSC